MMRNIRYLASTLQGVTRSENRDDYSIIEDRDYLLFLVFDGVSSYDNSILAIQKIKNAIEKNHRAYYHQRDFQLREAIYEMNSLLLAAKIPGMYTTVVALYIPLDSERPLKYSHLGDSRLYSYTGGNLIRRTKDHNLESAPNVLTKCLGIENIKEDDFYEKTLDVSGRGSFLLCTDGFYSILEPQISDYIKWQEECKPDLKEEVLSNLRGINSDDATYVCVSIDSLS